jgi:DNA replication protein DnaC
VRAGRRRACWQPLPNSNSPSEPSDVFSDICWRRGCHRASLPSGLTRGTLDSFDFATVPMVSHAHVTALASGDAWLKKGANILLFGPRGSGKSHLGAALGHALVENGYRVLFTRTTDLVQRLQTARPTGVVTGKRHRQARQVPPDYSR